MERRSRESVVQVDSSSVSRGAVRSTPGIRDVRLLGFRREVDVVDPPPEVWGVAASRGSSMETRVGVGVVSGVNVKEWGWGVVRSSGSISTSGSMY